MLAVAAVHFCEQAGWPSWSKVLVHTPLLHSVDPVSTTVVHAAPNVPAAGIASGFDALVSPAQAVMRSEQASRRHFMQQGYPERCAARSTGYDGEVTSSLTLDHRAALDSRFRSGCDRCAGGISQRGPTTPSGATRVEQSGRRGRGRIPTRRTFRAVGLQRVAPRPDASAIRLGFPTRGPSAGFTDIAILMQAPIRLGFPTWLCWRGPSGVDTRAHRAGVPACLCRGAAPLRP